MYKTKVKYTACPKAIDNKDIPHPKNILSKHR